jgi:hypothetical protein
LTRILARVAAIVAAALMLAGCIISDYDVSADLKPQFPLTAKAYRDGDGKVSTFEVSGNEYLSTEENKQVTHVRFFKIPEYSGYILQIVGLDSDKKTVLYAYFLADVTATEFVFHEWPKDAIDKLPAKIAALATVSKEDNVVVKDGRRDTLAVIREMALARLPTRPSVLTAVSAAK